MKNERIPIKKRRLRVRWFEALFVAKQHILNAFAEPQFKNIHTYLKRVQYSFISYLVT